MISTPHKQDILYTFTYRSPISSGCKLYIYAHFGQNGLGFTCGPMWYVVPSTHEEASNRGPGAGSKVYDFGIRKL